ncbi:MAG: FAD-dependent oxidoreductase [Coriobacteriia bacterium]
MDSQGDTKGLSRRDFMKGAAVLGAATAGSAILAGCSKAADGTDAKPAATGQWVDNDNTKPIPPVAVPAKWDGEADVVVVGAGGGGSLAAARLAEQGLSVITLEKSDHCGGTTYESAVIRMYGGPKKIFGDWGMHGTPYNHQAELDAQFETQQSSCNYLLWSNVHDSATPAVEWMMDQGADLIDMATETKMTKQGDSAGPYIGYVCWRGSLVADNFPENPNVNWVRASAPLIDFLKSVGEKNGTEYLLNTPATALVMDGDRVVGVQAKNKSGEVAYYKGNKAVLLTTGSFAGNRDMLMKYAPVAGLSAACCGAMIMDQGEGVRMAQGCGADVTGFGSLDLIEGGIDTGKANDAPLTWQNMWHAQNCISRNPKLHIDMNGRRIPYIDTLKNFTGEGRSAIQQAIVPGHRTYGIFDSTYIDFIPTIGQPGGRLPMTPDYPHLDRVPESIAQHDFKKVAPELIESSLFVKADTIEELEKKLELESGVLVKAVKDWNDVCASGNDNPLYGYQKEWLKPVEKAPFYGYKSGMMILNSKTGILVDENQRALTEKGKVIPGLYCASHTAGGFAGYGRIIEQFYLNVGMTYFTGWNACRHILEGDES